MRRAEHCERTDSEKIAFAPRETAMILVWCGTNISAAKSKVLLLSKTNGVYVYWYEHGHETAAEHAPKEL